MTLKGKQNHYNVKFLSGYGLSVSLKDNKIVLKNGTYPYSDTQEQEEWFITQLPYEKIVISGHGYVSTGNTCISVMPYGLAQVPYEINTSRE